MQLTDRSAIQKTEWIKINERNDKKEIKCIVVGAKLIKANQTDSNANE